MAQLVLRYSDKCVCGFCQICENIQQHGWKTSWIDDQGVPYAYGGDQWVGFETEDSLKLKVNDGIQNCRGREREREI